MLFLNTQAQEKKNLHQNDTLILVKQYFTGTKKLSAFSYRLKANETGRATAWNSAGKLIFSCEISLRNGHHSADFSFHKNGAVAKIEESQAPDAGIQWYDNTYIFSENGDLLNVYKRSYDDMYTLKVEPPFEKPSVVQPETVAVESPLLVHTLLLTNESPFNVCATVTRFSQKERKCLKPGDSVIMLSYVNIGTFMPPTAETQWDIALNAKRKPKIPIKWMVLPEAATQKDATNTTYRFKMIAALARK